VTVADPGLVHNKIGSIPGLGGSGEDCLAVCLQDLQPGVDILRVVHIRESKGVPKWRDILDLTKRKKGYASST